MVKQSMFKREDGSLLVVWKTPKGNLVGEVFNCGKYKRGKWDSRATFRAEDGDASEYRVREYFNFNTPGSSPFDGGEPKGGKKPRQNSYNVITTDFTPEYDEYLDHCQANGIEPQGEDSDDYWEYVSYIKDTNYECDLLWLRDSEDYGQECIITGSLDLWDGEHPIYPCVCGDIVKAIEKCYGKCDDLEVDFEDGVYHCRAYHHDGCNTFEIHKLSKKGVEAVADEGVEAVVEWDADEKNVEVRPCCLSKFKGCG